MYYQVHRDGFDSIFVISVWAFLRVWASSCYFFIFIGDESCFQLFFQGTCQVLFETNFCFTSSTELFV